MPLLPPADVNGVRQPIYWIILAIVGLLAAATWELRANRSLGRENHRLQEKVMALERVEAANTDLQSERDQLLRSQDAQGRQIQLLRSEVEQLGTLTNKLRLALLNQASTEARQLDTLSNEFRIARRDQALTAVRLERLQRENSHLRAERVTNPPVPRVGGWLGVLIGNAREENSNPHQGVVIRSLMEAGAAQQAKLQEGDVILTIDGESVAGADDLKRIMAQKAVGQGVTLEISRKDTVVRVNVKPLDWPQ